jgi:hypothetical protein
VLVGGLSIASRSALEFNVPTRDTMEATKMDMRHIRLPAIIHAGLDLIWRVSNATL